MPIINHDPEYNPIGKEKKAPIVVMGELSKLNKELKAKINRLEEELDTWKKAYATAENESRRFQEAYEEIYQKLYGL